VGSDFDTLLAVYTGATVNALTRVAYNDDCSSKMMASCVLFNVVPGTSYSIQVDGSGAAKGSFRIAVAFAWAVPSNDAFSAADTSLPATGTTLGATLETGERGAMLGKGVSASVWYRFSAAYNGTVQVLLRWYVSIVFGTPLRAGWPGSLAVWHFSAADH
jgi:hypothetical protein